MNNFLSQRILDNKVENILWFLGLILLAIIFKRYISKLFGSLLYRLFRKYSEENKAKSFNALMTAPVQLVILLLFITFGLKILAYPTAWNIHVFETHVHDILTGILKLVMAIAFTWLLLRMVDFIGLLLKEKALQTESKSDDQLVPFIKDSLKVVIVILSLFFILGAILKFNIASLIAGLGIGGLAVALAAQESLKNLFASITIFLDKPFTVGDVVTAGNITGTVEKVGFRSTRLRTSSKTYVTLPNKIMVESSVDNLTLRTHRSVNTVITLSYETSLQQLRAVVKDIDTYLGSFSMLNDENIVLFNDFTDNGFQLSISYFVPSMENNKFQEFKERVNYKILEIVQQSGATFAKQARRVEMINKQ